MALVKYASQKWISIILGVLLVTYAIFSLTGSKSRQTKLQEAFSNTSYSYPFGFASGMLGCAHNMNGIPVVLYAASRDWTAQQLTGNLQSHFIVSSTLIIIGQFLGGFWTKELAIYYLCSIPAIIFSVFLGKFIYSRINTHQFKQYVFYRIFILGVLNLVELF